MAARSDDCCERRCTASHGGDTGGATRLKHRIEDADITGTFVLFDAAANRLLITDSARAQQHIIPASTFKIASSLIALETAVVADESEVVPCGGKPQPRKAWAQDLPKLETLGLTLLGQLGPSP